MVRDKTYLRHYFWYRHKRVATKDIFPLHPKSYFNITYKNFILRMQIGLNKGPSVEPGKWCFKATPLDPGERGEAPQERQGGM